MAARIVLFGATGFTGELTARALAARGARPLLVGRDATRTGALAGELGLDSALADATAPGAPAAIGALLQRGDVLVSTVGPFVRWGEPAVRAAIGAGAHYLDSTGEPPFIRTVFERHARAAASAGSALLTAMGYDYVPGNLAGALALRDAGERAVRVDVGYFVGGDAAGQFSGGTRASAAGMLAEPAYAFRGGRLVAERGARRVRDFGGRPAISVGATEQFTLPRLHPGLRDVGVYLGWAGPLSRAVQAMSAATSLIGRVPGARDAFHALLRPLASTGSTGGPDAEARAKVGSLVIAEAFDARGTRLSAVRLKGVNPYDFTAAILAWGAQTASTGGLNGTGALGPADGFGLEALVRGCSEAGISRA
jgi:short subunit dehydrogenase-like uncharacterized protein